MNVQISSYFSKNEKGSPVFVIEMVNQDCTSWLDFKSSIEIEYDKHPTMKKSIADLASPETTPEKEFHIIQEILAQVTTIEGMKNCKIVESIDEEKKGIAPRIKKLPKSIENHSGFDEFTPFSANKNAVYFRKFVEKFAPDLKDLVEIDRNLFEALIVGHPELEEEYVQQYSTNASFFTVAITGINTSISFNFYIMYKDEIVLFFIAEAI